MTQKTIAPRLLLEEKLSPQVTDEVAVKISMFCSTIAKWYTPHPPRLAGAPSPQGEGFAPKKQSPGGRYNSLPACYNGMRYSILYYRSK